MMVELRVSSMLQGFVGPFFYAWDSGGFGEVLGTHVKLYIIWNRVLHVQKGLIRL